MYNLSNVLQLLFDDSIVIVGTTRPKKMHIFIIYYIMILSPLSTSNLQRFGRMRNNKIESSLSLTAYTTFSFYILFCTQHHSYIRLRKFFYYRIFHLFFFLLILIIIVVNIWIDWVLGIFMNFRGQECHVRCRIVTEEM